MFPDEDNDYERFSGIAIEKAAGSVSLEISKINILKGRVQVFKDVAVGKLVGKDKVASYDKAIELEFKITDGGMEKRPAARFHWIQFAESYILDAKGEEVETPYFYAASGVNFKTQKGKMYVDINADDAAYYDSLGVHRRKATEISIFDQPTFPSGFSEMHSSVSKFVQSFDAFLIWNDYDTLYHAHWESIQDYKDRKPIGAPYFDHISGEVATALPKYAKDDALPRGWGNYDKDIPAVSMLRYVMNPITKQARK